ncbi:hypothetical protein CcaverHIS002_0302760 [Cutaneotrichosporon cavernicola]|uniref:HAD-like protein n=1 Tax=Cutaneotrichosporon cavernicola TaxID=279322 RepID=A0AA48I6J2_9TREE|nr:uncharacterized protein CcaverHIS019_0302770 [Cutaneotrichosporon cavernicola]BEI82408.1 hypothetical protein CcaverHIS002_0302760 [Cutaneotrichosporon cavernicola]BEI90207.1 hypothetical protein CcaverHIS019_0302770 [Cutaneotrichosporon cavernicola]BEI97986.1 hypothetical protein CcaverHIS631_0302850 [Cutaneotrichosporon cavernicola]BEJ05762.1 hypothetical protein CcaverHIS641_0302840 [Cutaneotrichosporon cavernicola]
MNPDRDDCNEHGSDPLVIENDADVAKHAAGVQDAKTKGVLAIDMDDVLCNTNQTIVDMHADLFPDKANPPISIDEFEHYLYWHNRGWGTQEETVDMVGKLYRAGLMDRPKLLPGAREGLTKLKGMGYSLIVITARSEVQREGTEAWLEDNLPDLFDEIHFTGAFNHLIPATHAEHEGHAAKRAVVSHKKRTKHEVMKQTGAMLLVDDSAENALAAAKADEPPRVLLFGSYPWNAEIVAPGEAHPHDKMIYIDCEQCGQLPARRQRRQARIDQGWLPDNVTRVHDWNAVVQWIEGHEKGQNKL